MHFNTGYNFFSLQERSEYPMSAYPNAIKMILAAALLLSTAACAATQSAPSMVDYSYVPQNAIAVNPNNAGIESF